ncbi:MAG TPA: META domain-containing protein, partial [Sphingomicrobium sp.]|nr:META domain-containing protein [Sphingomicrobium sp.]
ASYTQRGNSVRFGPVSATRMACPDMTFEDQGSRILRQPATISGFGNRITLSNSQGSIELVQAR